MTDNKPLTAALDAQGPMEPGTEGYWQVWGARPADLRAGDLVMTKGRESGEYREYEILAVIPPDGGIADMAAPRFRVAGEPDPGHDDRVVRFGMLMAMVVFRRGTHHTLADSI